MVNDVVVTAVSGNRWSSSWRAANAPAGAGATARTASTRDPGPAPSSGSARPTIAMCGPSGRSRTGIDIVLIVDRPSPWPTSRPTTAPAPVTRPTASLVTMPGARSRGTGRTVGRGSLTSGGGTASGRSPSTSCWRHRKVGAPSVALPTPNTLITIIAPVGCAGYCASTATAASGSSGRARSSSPERSCI